MRERIEGETFAPKSHPSSREVLAQASRPRSHRARGKDVKRTKPRSLLPLKRDETMPRSRTKRRTKLSKRTQSTSLSPHPGKVRRFEFKGRETYLSDLLRPPGEVKILPPFPGFVVRHRLHLFVDFGRRHRDRGESERILCPSSHRRHGMRTHPTTTGDGGSGSGAMIFSRRHVGRSSSSRSE